MPDLSHISSQYPHDTEKSVNQKHYISLFFFSEQHPEHVTFLRTRQSVPAVTLQEHLPLQFYFQLSFPSQSMAVISSHLKQPVPPHRTQKGKIPAQRLSLQPETPAWSYSPANNKFCPAAQDIVKHIQYSDAFKSPPYLLFSVQR